MWRRGYERVSGRGIYSRAGDGVGPTGKNMSEDRSQQFVADLIRVQNRLLAYIASLMADAVAAEDVLQETNFVLWAKRDEFEAGTNFDAWAFRTAYWQVRAWRKKRAVSNRRFSDATLDDLAAAATAHTGEMDSQRRLLDECVGKLPESQRALLAERYTKNTTPADMAASQGRPVRTIYQTLYRIRLALIDCVNQARARAGEPTDTPEIA